MSMSPQLPLVLRPAPDLRFQTFIGSPDVVALLERFAAGDSDFVFLSGPAGSGKTHLAMAAAQAADEHGLTAQYVPLARFRGNVRRVLTGLEALGVVLLDDLDAVLGDAGDDDEIALFDFHNRARAGGCKVLYAAATPPAGLPPGLPDLRSRLGQCTQLILPRADDALRGEILRSKAQARGLRLDEPVIGYLLRRVGRDMASLTRLLDRLDRASLAEQRGLTVPFIRAFLEQEAATGS